MHHQRASVGMRAGASAVFGVDKNALQILNANLIPLPNSALGCNYALPATAVLGPGDPNRCYIAAVSPSTYWREELFRLDHNFAQALKISFSYIHDDWDTTVLTPQWSYLGVTNPAGETFPTVQNRFTGPGISLLANITQTITPTLINNFGLSYLIRPLHWLTRTDLEARSSNAILRSTCASSGFFRHN